MEQYIKITRSLSKEAQHIVFAYTLEETFIGNQNWIIFADFLKIFGSLIETYIIFGSYELAIVKAKILNPKVCLEFTIDLAMFVNQFDQLATCLNEFFTNTILIHEEYLYYNEDKFPTSFDKAKVGLASKSVEKLLPLMNSKTIFQLNDLKECNTLKMKWIDKINCLDISSQSRLVCLPDNNFLKLKVNLSLIVISTGVDYDMIEYFLTRTQILEIKFDVRSPKVFNSSFCVYLSRLRNRIHGNFSNIIWPLNSKSVELVKLAHPPLKMKIMTSFDLPFSLKLFSDISNVDLIDLDVTNMNGVNLINSNITQLRIKTDVMDFCDLTGLSKLYSLQVIEGSEGSVSLNDVQFPKQLTELAIFSDMIKHTSRSISLPKHLQILTTNTTSLLNFGFQLSLHLTELVLTNVSNTSELDPCWEHLPESLETLTIHQQMMFDLADAQRNKRFGIHVPNKLSHLTIYFPYSPGNRIYCINMNKPSKKWFQQKRIVIEGTQFWIRINISKTTSVKLVLDDETRVNSVMLPSNDKSTETYKIKYYHYLLCPSHLENKLEVCGVGYMGNKYNNRWVDKDITLFYNGPPVMKIMYNNLILVILIVVSPWILLNWLRVY